jgi:Cu+-exporting ATPase
MNRGASVAVDPVCGMTITAEKAAGMSRVGGTAYYFCSTRCNATFDAEPGRYAGRSIQSGPAPCCSTNGRTSCH